MSAGPGRGWMLREPTLVWLALLVLLAVTGFLAYVPMAGLNVVPSLAIGFAKAVLIGVFFMKLKQSGGALRLAAIAGFVFLFVLFLLSFADYLTRPAWVIGS